MDAPTSAGTPRCKVTVKRVASRGLVVTSRGVDGWLPATEWSFDERDWEAARHAVKAGDSVEVVAWGRSLHHGQPVYSRRRVQHDPWRFVDGSLLGKLKSFAVSRLTRRYAIGDLEPGLQARLDLTELAAYVAAGDRNHLWQSHQWVALGDVVAGLVTEIRGPDTRAPEPEVVLSGVALLEAIERQPEVVAGHAVAAVATRVQEGHRYAAVDVAPSSFAADRLLLVDNDVAFTRGVAVLLKAAGHEVEVALSEKQAREIVQRLEVDALAVALIDLHLASDLKVHDGLEVARVLALRHPRCKIVLITGEAVDAVTEPLVMDKIREGGDVPVAGYISKPFTFEQLQLEIAAASTARPKPLREFFRGQIDHERPPAVRTQPRNPEWRHSLASAVNALGEVLPDVVVHVFEMHPLDFTAESIAHHGEGFDWTAVRHKLDKSPVADTAVHADRRLWVDQDVEKTAQSLGRHFWLRKAFPYRSALGVPIQATSPYGYCLLAFHPQANALDPDFVKEALLCSERCGRALEWNRLMRQSEQRARFESAGMAFACLGHELRNLLLGIDASALLLATTAARGGRDLEHHADLIRDSTRRAIKIAQNFAGIQAPAGDEAFDVLDCLDEALVAARVQAANSDVEIRARDRDPASPLLVRGDRGSVFIAFFNLLLNAVQQTALFIRRRGIVWTEWRTSSGNNPSIEILFNDTGPGIHGGDFERIFAVGYTTKPEGTGMGLHICREVLGTVRRGARRGEVRIARSILNVGTTFSVVLPLHGGGREGGHRDA